LVEEFITDYGFTGQQSFDGKPDKERGNVKRNLALVVVIVVAILTVAIFVASFVFGVSGCFGGYGCNVSTNTSCSITTKACQIAISDNDKTGLVASSCKFDAGSQEIAGVLSGRLGGPPTTVSLLSSSSVTVYCSGYPSTPDGGAQASGVVIFSNVWETHFSGIWQ